MSSIHNLGFPRMGAQRELKTALEAHWRGELSEAQLRETGRELRARHWAVQKAAGVELIPVGDFAYYDHMLTATALFGAAPARFGLADGLQGLADYFLLARGNASHTPLEMTKWFDTNYHYLAPEFGADTRFSLNAHWLLDEVDEALALNLPAKPVLVGPLTYLWLGKTKTAGLDKLSLLPALLAQYAELLKLLHQRGVRLVQLDEPILALDLPPEWLAAFEPSYAALADSHLPLLLATYFGDVSQHAALLASLPITALHIDLVRAPEQLPAFLESLPPQRILSAGVVDGRNIWRNDLSATLSLLAAARARLGERLWLAPSCSLLHTPVDLVLEDELDAELKSWLAFATQKLSELKTLARGLRGDRSVIAAALADCDAAFQQRRRSPRVLDRAVTERLASLPGDARKSGYAQRAKLQQQRLNLPAFPTTTIGSFPQTPEIRKARAAFKKGALAEAAYTAAMQAEIRDCVERQERLGIDVLVHGEPERNDMVEYFGEQLAGFAFTRNGWVQSYGSRCVKPPLIYGDVSRPAAMTVEWSRYAQSLTTRPMKGMLTGPVTILQWSFVRDDQARSTTALQIALAIRDEVCDLERAGIAIIQIDEPAFREGLPLKKTEWDAYLAWAGQAFRLSASGVTDQTQIHTHMCYSEFNDILPAIAAMDADVITIETSRSDMELLEAFGSFKYPNGIGPGVYDIHSPRVPAQGEMRRLMEKARAVVPDAQLWINPDCGCKTRRWPETEAALERMVAVAKQLRV